MVSRAKQFTTPTSLSMSRRGSKEITTPSAFVAMNYPGMILTPKPLPSHSKLRARPISSATTYRSSLRKKSVPENILTLSTVKSSTKLKGKGNLLKRPMTTSYARYKGRNLNIKAPSSFSSYEFFSPNSSTFSRRYSSQPYVHVKEKIDDDIPTLPFAELEKIAYARCLDLKIKPSQAQQERFIEYLKKHLNNGQIKMVDVNLGMNVARELKRILGNNRYYISLLDLKKNSFGDEGIKILAKGIGKSTSLVHLDLSSNEIGREGADALFKSLKKNHSVNCLIVANCKGLHRNFFHGIAVQELNEVLRVHYVLTILDLAGTSVGNEGLKILLPGLATSSVLKVLNISFNMLTAASSKIVAELMGKSHIKRLDCSQNAFGDSLKFEINASTKSRMFLQTHLNFSKCNFQEQGMHLFFEAMRMNSYLINLSLDDCRILPEELHSLQGYLNHNVNLKSFSIRNSMLGKAGAEVVAEGIAENSALSELYLGGNRITNEGAAILAKKIIGSVMCRLKVLDISNNFIDDAGGLELARAIEKSKTLSALDFSNNHLRSEFALGLIVAFGTNTKVRKIDLTCTNIELKHLATINNIIEANRNASKKALVPAYSRQVDKMRARPKDLNLAQKKIQELEKEFQLVRVRVEKKSVKLKNVQEKEIALTSEIVQQKKTIDQGLILAVKQIELEDSGKSIQKDKNNQGVALMNKKINEISRVVNRLQEELDELKSKILQSKGAYKDSINTLSAKLKGEKTKFEIASYTNKQKKGEKDRLQFEVARSGIPNAEEDEEDEKRAGKNKIKGDQMKISTDPYNSESPLPIGYKKQEDNQPLGKQAASAPYQSQRTSLSPAAPKKA